MNNKAHLRPSDYGNRGDVLPDGYKRLKDGTIIDTEDFKEKSNMKDKIKQAVADEFKYRASQGRTNYSMEEVIYIVGEVIDEVTFEENEAESHDQTYDFDMQMRVIKGDLRYLAEKVNKLSSLLEEQKNKGDKAVQNEQ